MEDSIRIDGISCIMHRHSESAAHLDDSKHLILWNNDKVRGLYIDKYDCRCLLSESELPHTRTISSIELTEYLLESELELVVDVDIDANTNLLIEERFKDMKNGYMEVEENNHENKGTHWDYNSSSRTVSAGTGVLPPKTAFIKPDWFDFPADMVLPDDQQQYTIILHTVKKFIAAGKGASRLEILIKVRELNNSDSQMHFLLETHPLYPLYSYIKSLDESVLWLLMLNKPPPVTTSVVEEGNEKKEEEVEVVEVCSTSVGVGNNCLSMVADYGSDSDIDSDSDSDCGKGNDTGSNSGVGGVGGDNDSDKEDQEGGGE